MSDPLPPPEAPTTSAGWYPDPTGSGSWRWFDGFAWTPFVSTPAQPRKPRLPRFLSPPVLVCGVVVTIIIVLIGIESPWSVAAGLIPLAIVLPVLSWLDRVEPEPTSSRIHAVLWGATVAIVVSGFANIVTGAVAGEVVALVVSAPLIEEVTKALGIVWAVRRREVDGVSDGVVYAGWVALGFAVVEDMTYFAVADINDALIPTVILRAVLTPFAHPLFTFWSGLAIGLAVQRSRPIWPWALWGVALAVVTHAVWNGSLALADLTYTVDEDIATGVIVGAVALFVVLFIAVAITLYVMRRREQRRFVDRIPSLVARHGLTPDEAAMFTDWRTLLKARKAAPPHRRKHIDRVHASLARLSYLEERTGPVDPADRLVLEQQLGDALRRSRGTARQS